MFCNWRSRNSVRFASVRLLLTIIAIPLVNIAAGGYLHAQGCGGGGFGVRQSVGGVYVDASGVLTVPALDKSGNLARILNEALDPQPGDLVQFTPLRKVSLRRLEAEIAKKLDAGQPLTQEMRFLAGLQSVRYVLVYPEQQDIVLVGPAEGWVGERHGIAVGKTTNRPTLILEDLLVALRSVRRGGNSILSCSIDPTTEGLRKVSQYAASLATAEELSIDKLEELMGPQRISINGMLASSHFARVFVAADYRMKRLGMKLDAIPITGLPSYLDMLPAAGRGMQNLTPRWWLTPVFEPLLTDADGLAWELRGSKVTALTEDSFLAADGSKTPAGRTSPTAQQWATMFTKKYPELAKKDPIFAELQNCMELAVVAALIAKENLTDKAGYRFTVLLDPTQLPVSEYDVPRSTPTKASMLKKGSHVLVGASGGVEIRPAAAIEKIERTATVNPVHKQAAPQAANHWWWN